MSNPLTPGNSGWMPDFEDPEMPPAKEMPSARRSAAACSAGIVETRKRLHNEMEEAWYSMKDSAINLYHDHYPNAERDLIVAARKYQTAFWAHLDSCDTSSLQNASAMAPPPQRLAIKKDFPGG